MTRNEAFQTAKANRAAYMKADIDHMFGRGPEPRNDDYGYKHGWFVVGEFAFPSHELDGRPAHCPVQAAFAYL